METACPHLVLLLVLLALTMLLRRQVGAGLLVPLLQSWILLHRNTTGGACGQAGGVLAHRLPFAKALYCAWCCKLRAKQPCRPGACQVLGHGWRLDPQGLVLLLLLLLRLLPLLLRVELLLLLLLMVKPVVQWVLHSTIPCETGGCYRPLLQEMWRCSHVVLRHWNLVRMYRTTWYVGEVLHWRLRMLPCRRQRRQRHTHMQPRRACALPRHVVHGAAVRGRHMADAGQ